MGLFNILFNSNGMSINKMDLVSFVISASVVVFLVMPVHEFAHAYTANRLGDPTPRYRGRLSLNPLNHIDYFGALMIYLIGFGWAKPVGVDSRYFNNPKRDMAIVAFAGPLSNLCFAFMSSLLISVSRFILVKTDLLYEYAYFSAGIMPESFLLALFFFVVTVFQYVCIINISLAVFNLIPIPPLDGSKVLAAVLPDRIYWNIMRYERYMYFILIFFILAISRSGAFDRIVYNIFNFFGTITWFPFKLILG